MDFLHGLEVVEVTSGARPIRAVRSSVIGIVGTAPDADADKFPINVPTLIAGSRLEASKLDLVGNGAGTLPSALKGILNQAGAVVVVIRVEDDNDYNARKTNVIGGVNAGSGLREGVHALLDSESVLGFKPRILSIPGFIGDVDVVNESLIIADRLKAHVVVDGPDSTDADAITFRDNFDSRRLYFVDPHVVEFESGIHVIEPSSPRVAGLIAKVDNDEGFWVSPSNHSILGISGTSRPIDFALGDSASRANLLNENEVTTIIRQNGFRLWGNRTASSDTRFAFLNVSRAFDIINDSILAGHLWAVDRNITKTYFEDVAESANNFLRNLKSESRGAISATVTPDPDLNTPENFALGKTYFNIQSDIAEPAEHITFTSEIVNNLIEVL